MVRVKTFKATFNNISVISWRSVLLVEETGEPSCEFESCSLSGVLDTILCDKVCLWLVAGQLFSPDTPVSSTNKRYNRNSVESGIKHHNPNPWWYIFITATCFEKCDPRTYGPDCTFYCRCNNQPCDRITGACQCDPGYTGQHCELVSLRRRIISL